MSTGVHPPGDVDRAVRELGLDAVAWQPISTLGAGTRRVSYRVRLRDGRSVKVRRVLGDARCEQALRLAVRLELPHVARLLHHRGRVWVESWVPGRALDGDDLAQLEPAARLLAELHGVGRLDGTPLRERRAVEPWLLLARVRIEALRAAGALATSDADELAAALAAGAPTDAPCGLTHGDFAPDNLVLSSDGSLHAIDLENLAVAPLDLDLATAIVRWPLAEEPAARFVSAYARAAGRRPEHLGWWRIAAAAKSAAVRIAHYPQAAGPALARLRQLAARNGPPEPGRPA